MEKRDPLRSRGRKVWFQSVRNVFVEGESMGVIYGNSCEERCMIQLGLLSAADMATIASEDSVSFIHAVWCHIDRRSSS